MRIAFSGVPPARARDERSVVARKPERSPLRAEGGIGCMSPSLCGAHASGYLAPDRELLPLRVELLEGLPERGLGRGGLLLLRSPRAVGVKRSSTLRAATCARPYSNHSGQVNHVPAPANPSIRLRVISAAT